MKTERILINSSGGNNSSQACTKLKKNKVEITNETWVTTESADRVIRIVSIFIDGILLFAFFTLLGFILKFAGLNVEELKILFEPWILILILNVIYLFVHADFLIKQSQTVGKKLLLISMVTTGNKPAGFIRGYLLRIVPFSLIIFFLPWGFLILALDILFILLPAKRALHDYIAGTKVVKDINNHNSKYK